MTNPIESSPGRGEAIPANVYWSCEAGNFYDAATNKGMGVDFYLNWNGRKDEFPEKATSSAGLDFYMDKTVTPSASTGESAPELFAQLVKSQPCTLGDCPEGLFEFQGVVALKSEYATFHWPSNTLQSDAYLEASGKYFLGGTEIPKERERLIVTPLALVTCLPAPSSDLATAGIVPEGWQATPKEAADCMLDAGAAAVDREDGKFVIALEVYKAMLSVAPKPPAAPQSDRRAEAFEEMLAALNKIQNYIDDDAPSPFNSADEANQCVREAIEKAESCR